MTPALVWFRSDLRLADNPALVAAVGRAEPVIGDKLLADYARALGGIRAQERGQKPIKPTDPYLLRDAAIVLLDCALRPEECYRLRWEHVLDGALHIPFGKTGNARRTIPLPARVSSVFEMRKSSASSEWVFQADTKSGHIEQSTLKKRHAKACEMADLEPLPPYTFRHTCLTRWAAVMDPYTLAYLAGHKDFSTTRRYVHPQADAVLAAMAKVAEAKGGHSFGHSGQDDHEGKVVSLAAIN